MGVRSQHTLSLMTFVVVLSAGCFAPSLSTPSPAEGGFSTKADRQGEFEAPPSWSKTLTPGIHTPLPALVTTLASRLDGADIEYALVRPNVEAGERVPIIALASVYLSPLSPTNLRNQEAPAAFLLDNFVPHGYAVALIAARGTGGSGGCWDGYGAEQRADLDQIITHLATQDWASGAVGTIGLSYDGVTQWHLAAAGNPHVRTIVPIGSEPDLYSMFVRNGTPSLGASLVMPVFRTAEATGTINAFFEPSRAEPTNPRLPRGGEHSCPQLAAETVAAAHVARTGERDPGGWFAARDLRPLVEKNYKGSILLTHGFNDSLANPHLVHPWTQRLADQGFTVKQVLGGWSHDIPDLNNSVRNPTRRLDWAELLLDWFDYFLKERVTANLGPLVEVADSNGRWRQEDAWPPRDAMWVTFNATAAFTLSQGPDHARGSVDFLVPEPSRAVVSGPSVGVDDGFSPCGNCLRYASEPLDAGQRFAGLPRFHATVVPQGTDGYLSAFLGVDNGVGIQWLTRAQMSIRFAEGGDVAREVTPNQPIVLRMEFEPVDAYVRPGERLVLEVGQSGYGSVLSYYRAPIASAPLRLEVGGNATQLWLPTIERAEDAFFQPP